MNNHSITDEKIISASENEIVLEVKIPSSSDFFDGHFPEIHLVPAVAQIDMATYFIKKYFIFLSRSQKQRAARSFPRRYARKRQSPVCGTA